MQTELIGSNGIKWINAAMPAPEDLAELVREAGLEPNDAEFVAQSQHRPSVSVRDDYMIILIQVPAFNKQLRVTSGVPLYFIIRQDRLWTVHYEPLVALVKLLDDFTNVPEKRDEFFMDGAMPLALHVIGLMYGSAFAKLERLAKHIDIAEDAVFQGNERKMVEEVSVLVRDVMDFRKIMRLQNNLFATLPRHPLLTDDLYPVWLRVNGQASKLWDLLEGLYESTTELKNTNSNLLQYKENELLRMLTYYSIFSIPLVLAMEPIYIYVGKNLYLTIVYAVGIFLLISVLLFVFLRAKRRRVI